VKFTNLEMTFHDHEGYPAALSGGTWAMANPCMLEDMKSYGFNLYNTANNHSADYSHGGILATIQYLKQKDMLFSGTGRNLGEASRPCYLETKSARVALIGAASSFHESAMAGGRAPICRAGRD
jgi:poly-gamma-glutamate synthesis protein (capsule biosynthesis protein)